MTPNVMLADISFLFGLSELQIIRQIECHLLRGHRSRSKFHRGSCQS